VTPFVVDINQNYVEPSITRVNHVAVDKYRVYLSQYVAEFTEKLSTSPVSAFWQSKKPVVLSTYDSLNSHYVKIRELSTKYVALGLLKTNLLIRLVATQSCHYTNIARTSTEKFLATSKPIIIQYYTNVIVPGAKCAYNTVLEYSCKTGEATSKYTVIALEQIKQSYIKFLKPVLEKYVFVHISSAYRQYAKTYVDKTVSFFVKYYTLFRLNQALNISKKLASSSYNQAVIYFQKAKVRETSMTTPEPTTAEQEDLPTPTVSDAEYGSRETPLLTESETVTHPADVAALYDVEDLFAESTPTPDSNDNENSQELETKAPFEDSEIVITLAQEIGNWRKSIYESVEKIYKGFESSVSELESFKIDEIRPVIAKLLQDMTTTANLDYAVINKAIFNIESKTVLLENGETAEVDKDGSIIDHKITRQEFRELLAEKNAVLKEKADTVNTKLQSFISDLEVSIEEERNIIVDVYEEFAEVAINEFSKKMMYSTLASSFEDLPNKKDENSVKDWKEYVKVKKHIISKREELIQKKAELPQVQRLLQDIHETLRALEHENGNYYAILRAKANLAFQERERLEREEAEHIEQGEDYTITTTVVKFLTVNEDGSVETNHAEVDPVEEDEVSDVESDEDDFIPEDTVEEAFEELELAVTPEATFVVDTPERRFIVD
jgi:ElaB/YqjD/DUF883 family membrane-anchored ribosome-binding protein